MEGGQIFLTLSGNDIEDYMVFKVAEGRGKALLFVEGIYIQGMHEGVEALASGRLSVKPLLTHHLPLEKLGSALELTRDRPEGFMKALILY